VIDRRAAVLTYDLGTTRLKVALFDLRGRLLAQRASRHVEHRAGDRQWQDAEAWWRDAVRLTRALRADRARRGRPIAAISLSGRGNAAVFVDRAGAVLEHPWSDDRHAAELASLVAWRRGGFDLSNYAAALLAKKQWFVANAPRRLTQRLRHALYAKDFLLHRLTGVAVTDPTSGPDGLKWDPRVLAHTQTDADVVPRPALPWEVAAGLSREAARALGIASGTPVVVGAHDGICANVGAGAAFPGAFAITLGTHAVVRAVQTHRPPGAYRFYGLPPDRHVIGGNGLMGGRAADWFLDLVYGRDDRQRAKHFTAMDARAAAAPDGADGARFFPFLSGRVAPERRPGARAGFSGVAARHDAGVLYRAVLEGTAFAVKDIFEQIRGWCGEPAVVRLTGSGATSEVWCDILAHVVGFPLEASDEAVEGRGAAIFAAVALGEYRDYDTAARAMVPISHRYTPGAERSAAYARHHDDWTVAVDAQRVLDR